MNIYDSIICDTFVYSERMRQYYYIFSSKDEYHCYFCLPNRTSAVQCSRMHETQIRNYWGELRKIDMPFTIRYNNFIDIMSHIFGGTKWT